MINCTGVTLNGAIYGGEIAVISGKFWVGKDTTDQTNCYNWKTWCLKTKFYRRKKLPVCCHRLTEY